MGLPTGAFVDDTFLATSSEGDMQELVNQVAAFSQWAGIHVNVQKSEISAYDFSTGSTPETDAIRYHDKPFTKLAPHQPFKYLGIRMTLTQDWRFEKQYIWRETLTRLTCLREAKIRPEQGELALQSGISSVFRYSAGIVPWTTTELEKLTRLWAGGLKTAWRFTPGMTNSVPGLPRAEAGRQAPNAHEIYLHATITTWRSQHELPDDLRTLTEQAVTRDLRRFGVHTLAELRATLRVHPYHRDLGTLARIVRKCDEIGLNFEESTPLSPPGTNIAMSLHPRMWTWVQHYQDLRTSRQTPGQQVEQDSWGPSVRGIFTDTPETEAIEQQWQLTQSLNATISTLGGHNITAIEQLLTPHSSQWIQWADLPHPRPSKADFATLTLQLNTLHSPAELQTKQARWTTHADTQHRWRPPSAALTAFFPSVSPPERGVLQEPGQEEDPTNSSIGSTPPPPPSN